MKKFLLLAIIFISVNAMAQTDTSTTYEQYARMEATGRLFSNKVTIDLDFGDERSLWTDNRLRDAETGKLKKFNTVIDALNFLGEQGWVLVNAFPVNSNTPNSTPVYHYYFKKKFTK